MFCLECGTEMSVRATTCAVCGREVAGAAGAGGASPTRVAPARTQESGGQPVIMPMTPPTATAARPLLEAPGFPHDTPGRVLLLTAIGLAADLLAPWSNVDGQRQAMIHVGTPAVGLLLLFALTTLPLVRPSFRREPLVAVLPLVVGTFCAGIGMMYWVLLYRENEQASSIPTTPTPGTSVDLSAGALTNTVVIAPDIGLFLFLIGSAVLAVVGYQLFLTSAASRAPNLAHRAAPAGPASTAARVALGSTSAVAPVLVVASTTSSSALGAGAGQALAELNGHSGQNGHQAGAAGTPGGPRVGTAPQGEQKPSVSMANSAGARVVLPGSAAWNEAPRQPDVKRHSGGGGWPRVHGRLR